MIFFTILPLPGTAQTHLSRQIRGCRTPNPAKVHESQSIFFSNCHTQTIANSMSFKISVHMAFWNSAPLAFGPGTTVAKSLLQRVSNSEMKITALQYWPAIMFSVFGYL